MLHEVSIGKVDTGKLRFVSEPWYGIGNHSTGSTCQPLEGSHTAKESERSRIRMCQCIHCIFSDTSVEVASGSASRAKCIQIYLTVSQCMRDMQEKMEVQGMLDKASGKVKDLITLEMKLEQALETKRSKLAEKDPDFTAFGDFRNDDAGVRITYATISKQLPATPALVPFRFDTATRFSETKS